MIAHLKNRQAVVASLIISAATIACTQRSAWAGDVGAPQMQIYLGVNDGPLTPYTPDVSDNGNGTYNYNGYYYGEGWELDFSALGDPDPFVSNVVGLTNNSGVTNNYTFIVVMPSMSIAGGTVIGGSIGGSVTDSNNDGVATLASVGSNAIYTGQMDGLDVAGATLFNSPFTSTPVPFAGGTSSLGTADFGLPGPTFPGPALVGSIGIKLNFSLTAGDSAAITSFFNVQPVPAPAALALFGLAGLARSRRRR